MEAVAALLDRHSSNSYEGAVSPSLKTGSWCRSPAGWLQVGCGHGSVVWVPLRCRHCRGCIEGHLRRVRARLKHGLNELGGDCAMLTLTSMPGMSWVEVMKAWNKLRGWLRKRVPDLEYAAIKQEGSVAGMRHLHVVLGRWRYVEREAIKREWERLTGAYMVDIRRKGASGAVNYVVGYVTSKLEGSDLRKRVTYSRGFPKLPVQEARWRPTGERVDGSVAPAGRYESVLGSGLLVVKDSYCECMEGARDMGLDGHLFMQRLERWPVEAVDGARRV